MTGLWKAVRRWAAGDHWIACQPRSRQRRHRRLIGIFAPRDAIEAARTAAAVTVDRRAKAREHGSASRARAEERYRHELAAAITVFLDFAEEHAPLAEKIAAEATGRAATVGSGRVGRTKTIGLEQRAELAARACIRHQYTTYEDDLLDQDQEVWDDDFLYRDVKRSAQAAVVEFLARHRREAP